MIKPFSPTRVVGPNIIAEAAPQAYGQSDVIARVRGVEVTTDRDGTLLSARRVVLCEPHEYIVDEPHFQQIFAEAVAEAAILYGAPAPDLLHVLGEEKVSSVDGSSSDAYRRAIPVQSVPWAMVVEHLEGTSLRDILRVLAGAADRLPPEVSLAIVHGLVPAFRRAGMSGVGIALDRVLVAPNGRVRTDFYLPSEYRRQAVGAAAGIIRDDIEYFAPEVMRGDGATETSWMFSLAAMLFHLLRGRYFLETESTFATVAAIAKRPLPAFADLVPGMPEEVGRFIDRAVAFESKARFATWAEFEAALVDVRKRFRNASTMDVLAAIPDSVRPRPEPGVNLEALVGWESLPRNTLVSIGVPGISPARPRPARPTPVADPSVVYPRPDHRPMYIHDALYVDARPVTADEFGRFCSDSTATGDVPMTEVSLERARAYAEWAGKRLPTDEEWTQLVEALGPAKLAVGSVWEWTVTPADPRGHIVRGGRWRDFPEPESSPNSRSFETGRRADVGFRCVADRRPDAS